MDNWFPRFSATATLTFGVLATVLLFLGGAERAAILVAAASYAAQAGYGMSHELASQGRASAAHRAYVIGQVGHAVALVVFVIAFATLGG